MVPQPFQAQQAQNRIPPPTGPCLRLPSLSGAKDPSRCPEENRWLSSWAFLFPTPKPFASTPNSSHVHPSSLPASRHSCNQWTPSHPHGPPLALQGGLSGRSSLPSALKTHQATCSPNTPNQLVPLPESHGWDKIPWGLSHACLGNSYSLLKTQLRCPSLWTASFDVRGPSESYVHTSVIALKTRGPADQYYWPVS